MLTLFSIDAVTKLRIRFCRLPLRTILMLAGFHAYAAAQRDLKDIPQPDVKVERSAMRVDPLANVNLFAKDPDLSKPIQINFDATGGLWIASSNVYSQIRQVNR